MIVSIPMSNFADFTEEVTLDERPYILRFRWNTRSSCWVMAIYDRDSVLLVDGMRVVIGFPLKKQFVNSLLPPGQFICVDTNINTENVEPGRNDFFEGRNIILAYVGQNDL